MTAIAKITQPIDFERQLPMNMNTFSLDWIRRFLGCSLEHAFNLFEAQEFGATVDVRVPGASRAMIRVTRSGFVSFLNRRQDTQAIADANPRPAPRPHLKKRRRKR